MTLYSDKHIGYKEHRYSEAVTVDRLVVNRGGHLKIAAPLIIVKGLLLVDENAKLEIEGALHISDNTSLLGKVIINNKVTSNVVKITDSSNSYSVIGDIVTVVRTPTGRKLPVYTIEELSEESKAYPLIFNKNTVGILNSTINKIYYNGSINENTKTSN